MLKPCVCGTFHHEEEDERFYESPLSSPKKSKRNSKNNNPYSACGLEKFSALIADLDERRQRIYSQMNPHDISFVRFVYDKTDEVVPVVVKVKNKSAELNARHVKSKSADLNARHAKSNSEIERHVNSKSELMVEKSASESTAAMEERKQNKLDAEKKAEKKKVSWNMKFDMLRHPSFYVPAVIVLILSFLAVFGRSAATLCTCILWYIVPILSDSSEPRKSMKRKNYVRGMSEKKMASDGLLSPRSTNSGASKGKSRRKLNHQKSW